MLPRLDWRRRRGGDNATNTALAARILDGIHQQDGEAKAAGPAQEKVGCEAGGFVVLSLSLSVSVCVYLWTEHPYMERRVAMVTNWYRSNSLDTSICVCRNK